MLEKVVRLCGSTDVSLRRLVDLDRNVESLKGACEYAGIGRGYYGAPGK